MFQTFCRFLFWLKGWKVNPNLPEQIAPSVMIASPHTSNWDLIFMVACFSILKVPYRFTIKKEWMKWPFKSMMISVGAIPIDRTPKKPGDPRPSMVEAMAALFESNQDLSVVVTPEGTRSLRTTWKTGFYHVAKLANVPVALGYLDYKKKEGGVGKLVAPDEDMDMVMKEIMEFYRDIQPKHPEKFSVDQAYIPS